MNFVPLERADVPSKSTRSSAASTQLFDSFLASGAEVAKIDLDGKKLPSTRSSLQNYAKRHNLNVKVFTRGEDLYVERTDSGSATTAAAYA